MTLLTAAVALLALAMCAGGWLLWRIGAVLRRVDQNQQQTTAVLRDLHTESQRSAAEREARRANEAAGALFDAETVREARLLMAALETLPGCQPCKDELTRIVERRKVFPPRRVVTP